MTRTRRRLLEALGALGIIGTAGCAGSDEEVSHENRDSPSEAGTNESDSDDQNDDSGEDVEEQTAILAVDHLDPSELSVQRGISFDVTVEVENVGDAEGSQEVELVIGDEAIAAERVRLEPQTHERVPFEDVQSDPLEPAEYDLIVRSEDSEVRGRLKVTAPPNLDVETAPASDVGPDAATLNGDATIGKADEVEAWFEWTTAETDEEESTDSTVLKNNGWFSATVEGLMPETRYEFQAFLATETTRAEGKIRAFTTAEARSSPRTAWPMWRCNAGDTGFAATASAVESQPEEVWRVEFSDEFGYRHAPIVSNGIVYVGNGSAVLGIDASDGTQRWEYEINERIETTAAYNDGTVYVPGDAGTLFALDAGSGDLQWASSLDARMWGVNVDQERVYLSDGEQVYAVDQSDGELLWEAQGERTPTVGEEGVYGMVDGDLLAYKAEDGTELWRADPGDHYEIHAPVIAEGWVYAVTVDKLAVSDVITVIPEFGEEFEQIGGGDVPGFTVSSETVYIATYYGTSAFEVGSWEQQWSVDEGGPGSLLVSGAGDTVYVPDPERGFTYALATDDGSVRWSKDNTDLPQVDAVAGNTIITRQDGIIALTD